MDKILNKIKKIIPKKIFRAVQPLYHYVLSFIASMVYGMPSDEMIVIGVTGTTGKTTSVYLIAKMLEEAGYKVGYTSTAIFNDGRCESLNDRKMTMVGRFFTQKMLRTMVKNKCQYAIVETTSEGIRQHRHRFINYDFLVFTGLYPEHIESHGSFEKYKEAKGELFAHLKRCGSKYVDDNKMVIKRPTGLKKTELNKVAKTIIANGDDEHADYFLNFWAENKVVYVQDVKNRAFDEEKIYVIYYGDIKVNEKGTSFKFNNHKINLKLLGTFNVANVMNAVAIGLTEKLPIDIVKAGLEKIEGVAGRLEIINEGQDFLVIVDYAFEPNAISKLYETIKLIPKKAGSKIIHVLGSAGGGRDVARRPVLGQLAGKNADLVIVTNEDPYDDDPQLIIDQVAIGAEKAGKKINENLFKILDRRAAIEKAIKISASGDIVLVTGKGSEQAICMANSEKISWDDRAVVRGLLNSKK